MSPKAEQKQLDQITAAYADPLSIPAVISLAAADAAARGDLGWRNRLLDASIALGGLLDGAREAAKQLRASGNPGHAKILEMMIRNSNGGEL